jgi:hypothetical protein
LNAIVMLSTKHRFLFVHIPKTGGNSVQSVLQPFSDDSIVRAAPYQDGVNRFEVRSTHYRTSKHSTIADYRREYGDEMLSGLFKFCCVRNPWERALSDYFSPHRGPVMWDKQRFIQFLPAKVKLVKHFLVANANDVCDLPEAIKNVDFVVRFERLQADFNTVCDKLNLPLSALPHYNASGKAAFRDYYDDETIDLVAKRFHEEIECFGYTFPG